MVSSSRLIETGFESLQQISRVLTQSLDFEEISIRVLDIMAKNTDLHLGLVLLSDKTTGDYKICSACGIGTSQHDQAVFSSKDVLLREMLQVRQPVISRTSARDLITLDRYQLLEQSLPVIIAPLRFDESVTTEGLLIVQPLQEIDDQQEIWIRFVEIVANMLVGALCLIRETKSGTELHSREIRHHHETRSKYGFKNIIGQTPSMRRIFEQSRQVAKWNTTVLLRGESGTGKELIANAIHYNSARSSGPFVKLNCAALADNLLESELFGHEKGAFTGATSQRKGRFERAHVGTMFLDEIGEISPAFQAKLLRVLQEGEFEHVGGNQTIKVDVRIIAATNRDLEAEVELGNFREDLYYRLNIMPIYMPALRERIDDIPELASFILANISQQQQCALSITESALRLLMRYDWPGNVRELENMLERAAIMSGNGIIDRDAIIQSGINETSPLLTPADAPAVASMNLSDPELDERERVIAALEQTGWVQAKAARLLGMTPRQIAYRIQTLNIKVRRL